MDPHSKGSKKNRSHEMRCYRKILGVPNKDHVTNEGVRARGFTFTWWGCYGSCPRHKPTKLALSFYYVLVYDSLFMALSTVFHSTNSPDNSPLSHCVILVYSALLVLSTIYLFMKVSLSSDIILCG